MDNVSQSPQKIESSSSLRKSPDAIESKREKIRILRLPEVISRVGLKRASIYLYVSEGTFPKPVSLGSRAVGWIEYEVDGWISERIKMRHRSKKE
jgi:prophage regulatory protein